jgi:kinetochore protein Nuf2
MCGVRDFSLVDLINPDAKRTLFILSAIVNFEKFRVDRLRHFEQYQEHAEQLAEARADADARLHDVKKRNGAVRAQIELEAPTARELQSSIATLEASVERIAARQQQLRGDTAATATFVAQHRARADAAALASAATTSEIERLRARIVPSPEQLRRTLVELSQAVEALKKENMSSNVHCRETQAKSELLDKISGSLGKRVASLEDLTADLARIRKMSKDAKDHSEAAAQAEAVVKEIEAQEEHLKEAINELFDKTTRQKKNFEYKKRRTAMALEEVQAQRAQLAREQEQDRVRLAALEVAVSKKQHEVCVVAAAKRDIERIMPSEGGRRVKCLVCVSYWQRIDAVFGGSVVCM